jgi:hypothetical protein
VDLGGRSESYEIGVHVEIAVLKPTCRFWPVRSPWWLIAIEFANSEYLPLPAKSSEFEPTYDVKP